MVNETNPTTNEHWRVVVVGAEDVAQHLRKAGHHVLSVEQLPELGLRGADAAIVEIGGTIDVRSANRFRSKLVEAILIHRGPSDRSTSFLSLRRKPSGEVALALVEECLRHAVERTNLMRRIEREECDVDGPTQEVTLKFPVKAAELAAKTRRARRRVGGAS